MRYNPMSEEDSARTERTESVLYRWLKVFWLIEIARLLAAGASYAPALNEPARWGIQILAAVGVVCLFCLGPACRRYRWAALLRGAVLILPVAGLLITGRTPAVLLTALELACSLGTTYQEFRGHAAVVAEKEGELAGKWVRLLWVTLLFGVFRGAEVFLANVWFLRGDLALLAAAEPFRRTWAVVVSATGLLLRLAYLWYLGRTARRIASAD